VLRAEQGCRTISFIAVGQGTCVRSPGSGPCSGPRNDLSMDRIPGQTSRLSVHVDACERHRLLVACGHVVTERSVRGRIALRSIVGIQSEKAYPTLCRGFERPLQSIFMTGSENCRRQLCGASCLRALDALRRGSTRHHGRPHRCLPQIRSAHTVDAIARAACPTTPTRPGTFLACSGFPLPRRGCTGALAETPARAV
jgi:hypothetical protein